MMVRRRMLSLAKVMLALVVGTAMSAIAEAADLPLRPHKQTRTQNNDNPTPSVRKPAAIKSTKKSADPADDITGSIRWPANMRASLPPATAAISHTFAARATFDKARAAMDLGILLLDDAPKANLAELQSAVASLGSELDALEQLPQNRSNPAIKVTKGLVKDWYEAGLKIVKPPPQGVRDLPFPVSVDAKANAVTQALDQLIGDASAPRRN